MKENIFLVNINLPKKGTRGKVIRHDTKTNNQFYLWLGTVDKLTEEYHAKTAEIATMLTETAWQEIIQLLVVLVYRQGEEIRGPFLEGLEMCSQIAESRSNISNLMITELFHSYILHINRGSLNARSFGRKDLSDFR